jgi:AP-4 complex subunit epsilon-1
LHQMAVIDCLEDPDETLKRKTLTLLYKMTNPGNVEVIVERMVDFLRGCTDAHVKRDTVSRVIELAERYAPSNQWFVATVNQVKNKSFSLAHPM